MHMVGQFQMPEHDGSAADRAVRAYARTAGHADTAGQRRALADAHVLADLYQVGELDAVFDHGVLQRAAVYAGVGADLYIVANAHGAELLDFDPLPVLGREAKAVSADHHAGVQQAARADAAVHAHGDARLEPAAGADLRAPLKNAQRADAGRGMDLGRRIEHCTGVHAGRWRRRMVLAP